MENPVIVWAYDPDWPGRFLSLRERIADVLGDMAAAIASVRLYADRFPEGLRMLLRVSRHFGSILTVREPRFWHLKELNFFAKHERALSVPGMFSITKQLRDMLSQAQREKFPDSRCKT